MSLNLDGYSTHTLSQTSVAIGQGYWGTASGGSGTSWSSSISSNYITKEELELTLTRTFRKQRLILERKLFTEAGLNPKTLKEMLDSNDPESVKYAETIIDEFI